MTLAELVNSVKSSILGLNEKEYGDYAITRLHAEERARNIIAGLIDEIHMVHKVEKDIVIRALIHYAKSGSPALSEGERVISIAIANRLVD